DLDHLHKIDLRGETRGRLANIPQKQAVSTAGFKSSRQVVVGGQDEGQSILGREMETRRDQNLFYLYRRTRLSCNLQ
ncbi:hypothetical protein Golob_012062, partial [Gossypium lobatum]|nr:hypothetical protein [Gossypium lobatum]